SAGTIAEQIRELRPDVVIAEFEGHNHTAIENFLAIFVEPEPESANEDSEREDSASEDKGETSIVLLTDEYQSALTDEAVRLGVRAALPRSSSGDEIIAAVEAAAAGLIVLRQDSMESFLNAARSKGS